jgi:predicted RNase H-like HicB family nuclease
LAKIFYLLQTPKADKLEIMTFKAIIHTAEEGGFWAEVPALPGCVTQGDTKVELELNLREAIEGWLAAGQDELTTTSSEQILELAI